MKRYYTNIDNYNLKANSLYPKVPTNIDDLFNYFLRFWSKDSCAPRLSNNWTKTNPTVGQCSITAFIIQDIFGGDVYGIKLDDGNYHCFNVIDNLILDLTCEQFKNTKLDYLLDNIQSRDVHFIKKEKYLRYLKLKELIDNDNKAIK